MEFTEASIHHVDTAPVFTCAGLQDVSQEHGSLEISICTLLRLVDSLHPIS